MEYPFVIVMSGDMALKEHVFAFAKHGI